MSAHLAARRRTPIAGYLAMALGLGMITFALLGTGGPDGGGPVAPLVTTSSSVPATVLGSVVTRDVREPAEAATPATFELPLDSSAPPSSTPATTSPPSTAVDPTTTTEASTTTSTTEATTTTSSTSTTTTTEPDPTTTTTEEPPTDGG